MKTVARKPVSSVIALIMLVLGLSRPVPAAGAGAGSVHEGEPMKTPRSHHTATLLPDGRVLIAGGENREGILVRAELYDSTNGTWTWTSSMKTAREFHTATLLSNGTVLVAGGFAGWREAGTNSGYRVLADAEIYDPALGRWSAAAPMTTPRRFHTATALANGKVLVVGGQTQGGDHAAGAELYDPDTGTWKATGPMSEEREGHSAVLLRDGRVLVTGGSMDALTGGEIYDPAAGTWKKTGPLPRPLYPATATLLADGGVLITGELDGTRSSGAEVFDPASEAFSIAGPLTTNRFSCTAILLPNGKVLLAGGTENEPENFHALDKAALSTELFDPDGETVSAGRRGQRGQRARRRGGITEIKGTWTLTGPLNDGHYGHTATLLPNGNVLLAGGKTGRQPMSIQKPGGQVVLEDSGMYAGAELYDPATGKWTAMGH